MKRRTFLKLFTLAAAGFGTTIKLLEALPVRCMTAIKSKYYPGPVRELDQEQIRKQGPWAG